MGMRDELQNEIHGVQVHMDAEVSFDTTLRWTSRLAYFWSRLLDLRKDVELVKPRAVVLMAGKDRASQEPLRRHALRLRQGMQGPPVYISVSKSRIRDLSATDFRGAALNPPDQNRCRDGE